MQVITDYISVEKAAAVIGVTEGRIRQLLRAKQLAGEKLHHMAWIVDRKDAERLAATEQKTGRPRAPRNQ